MQICRVKKLMENESSEKLYNNVISKSGSSKTTLNYSLCMHFPLRIVVLYRGQGSWWYAVWIETLQESTPGNKGNRPSNQIPELKTIFNRADCKVNINSVMKQLWGWKKESQEHSNIIIAFYVRKTVTEHFIWFLFPVSTLLNT